MDHNPLSTIETVDEDIALSLYDLVRRSKFNDYSGLAYDGYARLMINNSHDIGYLKFHSRLIAHFGAIRDYRLFDLAFSDWKSAACDCSDRGSLKYVGHMSDGLFSGTMWLTGMKNQEMLETRISMGLNVGNKLRENSDCFVYTFYPIYSSSHDIIDANGPPRFLISATEYINGNSLENILSNSNIALELFKSYISQIRDALSIAWSKYKFKHNRLLARNIIISGRPVITNFQYCSYEESLIFGGIGVYDDGISPIDDMRFLLEDAMKFARNESIRQYINSMLSLNDQMLSRSLVALSKSSGVKIIENTPMSAVKAMVIPYVDNTMQSLILAEIFGIKIDVNDEMLTKIFDDTIKNLKSIRDSDHVMREEMALTFDPSLIKRRRLINFFAIKINEINRLIEMVVDSVIDSEINSEIDPNEVHTDSSSEENSEEEEDITL